MSFGKQGIVIIYFKGTSNIFRNNLREQHTFPLLKGTLSKNSSEQGNLSIGNKTEKVAFSRNQGNMLPFPLWEAFRSINKIHQLRVRV